MGNEHSLRTASHSHFDTDNDALVDGDDMRRFSSPSIHGQASPAFPQKLGSVTACSGPSQGGHGWSRKRAQGIKLLPLSESLPLAKRLQAERLRDGDAGFDGLRVSGIKSENVPKNFAVELRKAIKWRRATVTDLLRRNPQVTNSGLLFSGDSECLAVMSEVVRRRGASLLSAFFEGSACAPEQIWPSNAPDALGPPLARLFSPQILGDASKGTSHCSDELLQAATWSSPSSPVQRLAASPRCSGDGTSASSHSAAAGPSQYTYLYLPAPPDQKGANERSMALRDNPGGLQEKGRFLTSSWSVLSKHGSAWYEAKQPPRESQEGKRVLRALAQQRALRLGDVILLEGDSRCIATMLEHVSRPSLFLVAAAAAAGAEAVETLLRKGANPNRVVHGLSPLNVAASSLQAAHKKVELLLRYGAAPDSPLVPVAAHAAPARVTYALSAPDRPVPTVADSEDVPALMHAVITGDLRLAELLLQQGADPNIFVEALGLPTPLFQAVFWGDLKMVQLLCAYGADPYIAKQNGETVFQTASRALKFALLRKPKHIAQLPLPRTSPARCRQVQRALDDCCAARATARTAASVSAVGPSETLGLQARRAGFRATWESRVLAPARREDARGDAKIELEVETATEATTSSERPLDDPRENHALVHAGTLFLEFEFAGVQVLPKRMQSSVESAHRPQAASPASTAPTPPRSFLARGMRLSSSVCGEEKVGSRAADNRISEAAHPGNEAQAHVPGNFATRPRRQKVGPDKPAPAKKATAARKDRGAASSFSFESATKPKEKTEQSGRKSSDRSQMPTTAMLLGKGLSLSFSLRDDGSFLVEQID
ncbi:putative ankyrin repeat-containing protein [Neospora caninum Liverpool]|uniref:Ankyrin repeat-containing protein, putative n=1 Tax=Neospora caninum (strain Liverpool) TaxID=572307 RepID=F0VED3_NEOCL|nr:putative ankyrin repeat-containing protein [Neospora caninum Liverpool]CBZ52077.1 putative ankyrin repeat-containing protein [Neospora caninum Liverpool]CEL66038.1 TPA: ankyrin repeat-containing protein, putative [Neospora caninum Liverpool]|eukprot:XP_003882109.1 putative ankyrin repeat-containing protein [Neospora caninum Liverpool]